MTNHFVMNGYLWHFEVVEPMSNVLIDRTGKRTVATTDPDTQTVYLSSVLSGDFLTKVIIHELGHCAIISFNLIADIRKMVYPEYWIDAEEWICNFIADYGMTIFRTAYQYIGNRAIMVVPRELERLIA